MALVDGQLQRTADLVARAGVEQLFNPAGAAYRLQQGHGAVDVLHHRVAGRVEGQGSVGLRGQVGHHRMAVNVVGLDVLEALPEVAEVGVFQFTSQHAGVGWWRGVQTGYPVAQVQERPG